MLVRTGNTHLKTFCHGLLAHLQSFIKVSPNSDNQTVARKGEREKKDRETVAVNQLSYTPALKKGLADS